MCCSYLCPRQWMLCDEWTRSVESATIDWTHTARLRGRPPMRMSNLLDHRLLAQSHYRNSISPSSAYSEDEDRASEHSGSANLSNLSNTQSAVNNLLSTNHSSSNSGNHQPFPFNMNGNSQSDLQNTLACQHAANAAAQIVRKLQQHQNQLNNSSANNNALAAAAAQLSQPNAFSNYSAFYNAAAAALNNGADLPLLGNINNLANSLKGVNNVNSHALANALSSNGAPTGGSSNGPSPQSPYIATNQYTEITYKGQQVAAFLAANKSPTEYLLCLPQAFELFLKHLVGGLHTVYTKLKVSTWSQLIAVDHTWSQLIAEIIIDAHGNYRDGIRCSVLLDTACCWQLNLLNLIWWPVAFDGIR